MQNVSHSANSYFDLTIIFCGTILFFNTFILIAERLFNRMLEACFVSQSLHCEFILLMKFKNTTQNFR